MPSAKDYRKAKAEESMTANLCDWAMDRMSGYVAKQLSANDDRKMRAHLQKCEKCRADKKLEVGLLKMAKGK